MTGSLKRLVCRFLGHVPQPAGWKLESHLVRFTASGWECRRCGHCHLVVQWEIKPDLDTTSHLRCVAAIDQWLAKVVDTADGVKLMNQ